MAAMKPTYAWLVALMVIGCEVERVEVPGPCPPGAYTVCEARDTIVPCDLAGHVVDACALATGVLTHDCAATCVTDLCTKSADGVETCCDHGQASTDPCEVAK